MKISKHKLSHLLAKNSVLGTDEARIIINTIFDIISEELADGNSINLYGFGRFIPFFSSKRKYYNTKYNKVMERPSVTTPKFYASKTLKEKVKSSSSEGSQRVA